MTRDNNPDRGDDGARAEAEMAERGALFPIRRKDAEEPCGECHIQPGETCDICGAYLPAKPLPAPQGDDGVAQAWQELLEKDDRTSPAEYPDMALITFDEFASALRAQSEKLQNAEAVWHGYASECEQLIKKLEAAEAEIAGLRLELEASKPLYSRRQLESKLTSAMELGEIAALETRSANATVRRMAAIARTLLSSIKRGEAE